MSKKDKQPSSTTKHQKIVCNKAEDNALKEPILLYQTEDGLIRIDVRIDGETVWLTQQQIAQLFERERSVITKHIRNLFEESNVQNVHIAHE